MSTRTVVVFGFLVFSISVSRSLHFESFSTVFIEVFFFFSIGDRHINKRASSLLLVFHYYVWPVCLDLFVCLGWPVPECSHCVVFSYCRWLMFVIFVLYFDAIVLTYCCLIMSLYVLCFGKVQGILRRGGPLFPGVGCKFYTLDRCLFSELIIIIIIIIIISYILYLTFIYSF